MTTYSPLNRRRNLVFHVLGLSCVGGAILLQLVMFSSILTQGYFRGAENNPTILAAEIVLTGFGLVYFIYMYQGLIRTIKQNLTNKK